MAKHGFPLSIDDIKGFAYAIAKERNNSLDALKGLSRKWRKGFKSHHPEFGLRRTEALDRRRAKMGNVSVVKGYFDLLEDTLKIQQPGITTTAGV